MLKGLYNLYYGLTPFSYLLVFPHFFANYEFMIDKIIFTCFLNFLFSFSLPPPLFMVFLLIIPLFYWLLHFWSGDLFFSYFTNFLISFFKFFLIFVVPIQFQVSSFINLALFYHLLHFLFLNFYPFFLFIPPFLFLFLFPHPPFPLHISITPLWWFPQYSLIFPSFSLIAAFHSSSIVWCNSDLVIFSPILQISSSVSSNSS